MALFIFEPAHKLQPVDTVWVKRILTQSLEPTWEGPYPVVLTTSTGVKVVGVIHDSTTLPAEEATEDKDRGLVTRSSKPIKDKTGTGPMTVIVLFCLLCSPVGKAQNPHEPGPWVWGLRKNGTGELIPS